MENLGYALKKPSLFLNQPMPLNKMTRKKETVRRRMRQKRKKNPRRNKNPRKKKVKRRKRKKQPKKRRFQRRKKILLTYFPSRALISMIGRESFSMLQIELLH